MNRCKIIAAFSAACTGFGVSALISDAASYIVETFDTVVEEECLEYQPYDDAGKLVISLNQDMRTYVTVKQLSQEKEYYLFYDLDLSAGETTYVLPLEAGDYEVTIGVPYAGSSKKIMEYKKSITIENPDFHLDLQSTMYHYTLWRTEEPVEAPVLLQENSSETDGVRSVYQALEFQQVSALTGDANEDGMVDIADASIALSVYAKRAAGLTIDEYSEAQLNAADVNGSSVVDIADASAILSYYAQNAAGLTPTWDSIIGK